jgi:hypothetical protein
MCADAFLWRELHVIAIHEPKHVVIVARHGEIDAFEG